MTPPQDQAVAVPTTAAVRHQAAALGIDLRTVTGSGAAGRVTLRDLPDRPHTEPARDTQWLNRIQRRREHAPAATPLARTHAAERGLDLRTVRGTGPGAQIRSTDLTTSGASASPTPTPVSALPGTTTRLTTAQLSAARERVATLQETAQLTTFMEVDVTTVMPDLLPSLVLAVSRALPAHPALSADFDLAAGTVTYPSEELIDVHSADSAAVRLAADATLSTAEVRAMLAAGQSSSPLAPALTFDLTVAADGALFETALLPAGSTAILSMGTPVRRAMVTGSADDDGFIIRTVAMLALTYDHRIIDGANAARFLGDVCRALES